MAVTDTPAAVPTAGARLAQLPTPLHDDPAAGRTRSGCAGRLLVKRDDLTGFAVAGNKARPLEVLVAEAPARGADVLVTGGAPSSNFCAGRRGRRPLGRTRVRPGATPARSRPRATPTWPLRPALGAQLRWTGVADRASVDAGLETRPPSCVDVGAARRTSCRAAAPPRSARPGSTAPRSSWPTSSRRPAGRHAVVVASGRAAPLPVCWPGRRRSTGRLAVLGASVSRHRTRPGHACSTSPRAALTCVGRRRLRRSRDLVLRRPRARARVPSDAGERAAAMALRDRGLVLDPVYTAKALGALPVAASANGPSDPDLTTVFWHTGGLLDAVAGVAADDRAGPRPGRTGTGPPSAVRPRS